MCKLLTYMTLFRLTEQQSHNKQHNTIILNQTLKREGRHSQLRTYTQTHTIKKLPKLTKVSTECVIDS